MDATRPPSPIPVSDLREMFEKLHHHHHHKKDGEKEDEGNHNHDAKQKKDPEPADQNGRPRRGSLDNSSNFGSLKRRQPPPPPTATTVGVAKKGGAGIGIGLPSPTASKVLKVDPTKRPVPVPVPVALVKNAETPRIEDLPADTNVHPLNRKPPPPPPQKANPAALAESSTIDASPVVSVSALRDKFGASSFRPHSRPASPQPNTTQLPPVSHNASRTISKKKPSPPLPPRRASPPSRRPDQLESNDFQGTSNVLQSPALQLQTPSPTSGSASSSSEDDSDSPPQSHRAPPPLPSRTKSNQDIAEILQNEVIVHGRDMSLDSLATPLGQPQAQDSLSPKSSTTSPPPPAHPQRSTSSQSTSTSPRLPLRMQSSPLPSVDSAPTITTPTATASRLAPPSHPSRHGSANSPEVQTTALPRLPVRRTSANDMSIASSSLTSSPKNNVVAPSPQLAAKKVLPPPTRSIGPDEKLPPVRPSASGASNSDPDSSDEEEDEDEIKPQVDMLPDASRSSRRPPLLPTDHNEHLASLRVPHHSHVRISGEHVVVAHNHVKVFSVAHPDKPIYDKEVKHVPVEWRGKDPRVTAMEFRVTKDGADKGAIMWFGTKDGHIWEMDVRTGELLEVKHGAHTHPIQHIWRRGGAMVTVDEIGKCLVFQSDPDTGEIDLSKGRTVRITDKQDFCGMMGPYIFTANRNEMSAISSTTGGAALKAPQIKAYGIANTKAVTAPMILVPKDPVGPVTCACTIPARPDLFFFGHEGGYVSVWSWAEKDDSGKPTCSIVKISLSDVLCLEGVHDRLWAGSRNGEITAYDVSTQPWTVTNRWEAHKGVPVTKIAVDPHSIDKLGHLLVMSFGRDEQVKIWDGLFGRDWVENELIRNEVSYSTFRDMNVLLFSWNVDGQKPDQLNGPDETVNVLNDALLSLDSPPDIILFGLQECVNLGSKKMGAKGAFLTVRDGGNKKDKGARGDDDGLSEKYSRSYRMWHDRLTVALRVIMPADTPYSCVHSENMIGLFTTIFVKSQEKQGLKDVSMSTVKRGFSGQYGNKGAIISRFVLDDTSFCYVNCHLAAGQSHVRQRNADLVAILEGKDHLPPTAVVGETVAYGGGGDGQMVMDHEIVMLAGDLNYRIEQSYSHIIEAIKAGEYDFLRSHDQLIKQMRHNPGFRLRPFTEAPLNFPPTYKYDRHTDSYDTSEKKRPPAWCDRVLWRTREDARVESLHYRRYEAKISDHRPISAGFRVTVKSVNPQLRAAAKAKVELMWTDRRAQYLAMSRQAYVQLGIL